MKRARPRNDKAAQRKIRQREIEYLRRQREEKLSPQEIAEEEQSSMPDISTVSSAQDIPKVNGFSDVDNIPNIEYTPSFEDIPNIKDTSNDAPTFESAADSKEAPTEFVDYVGEEAEIGLQNEGTASGNVAASESEASGETLYQEEIPEFIKEIPSIEGFTKEKAADTIPNIKDVPDVGTKGKKK
ncbi:MAG: hypothetical protein E7417_06165, partial [Ruminococcaceae bacterium]|nr:hypothetical protein [Oscillospiraceae bacterium]